MWNRIFPMELGGILLLVLVNFFLRTRRPNEWYDLKPTILILVLCWAIHLAIWNAYPIFDAIGRTVSRDGFFRDESLAITLITGPVLEAFAIIAIRSYILRRPVMSFLDGSCMSRNLLRGAGIAVITVGFLYVLSLFASRRDFKIGGIGSAETDRFSTFVVIISLVVVAPILEEIIFRGYMFFSIERSIGKLAAVVVTPLAWALFHLEGQFVGYVINGIILTLLFINTKSLIPPIMFHVALNLFYVLKWLAIF